MLNMAKNQEGRDIASTGEKNQINCAILMKSLNGWERQYFYGAAGALSLIKNVPSPWKAFRSIFDLDHKSRRLCLWVHMHSGGELWVQCTVGESSGFTCTGGRALRTFLMDLLTFLHSESSLGCHSPIMSQEGKASSQDTWFMISKVGMCRNIPGLGVSKEPGALTAQ